MIGKAAGITNTNSAIEDLFPIDFYLDCVNKAYGIFIKEEDLPVDGSDMVTKRVETVLQTKYRYQELDKGRIMAVMLKKFDTWKNMSDLPQGTAEKAASLFSSINSVFEKAK